MTTSNANPRSYQERPPDNIWFHAAKSLNSFWGISGVTTPLLLRPLLAYKPVPEALMAYTPKDEPLVPYRPTPSNTPARLATSIAADYVVENWITSSRSSATLAASRKARTLGAIRGLGVTNCTGSESGS
jgi:hypothetical protein